MFAAFWIGMQNKFHELASSLVASHTVQQEFTAYYFKENPVWPVFRLEGEYSLALT